MVGWRGFDILIEAFSKWQLNLNKNISLNILGSGRDNELDFRSLITKLKMNSFIKLQGQVTIQEVLSRNG